MYVAALIKRHRCRKDQMIARRLVERHMSNAVPEAAAVLADVEKSYAATFPDMGADELTPSVILRELSHRLLMPALERFGAADLESSSRLLSAVDRLMDELSGTALEFEAVFLGWADSLVSGGVGHRAAALAPPRVRLLLFERARAVGVHADGQPMVEVGTLEAVLAAMSEPTARPAPDLTNLPTPGEGPDPAWPH
jgi:hypothetical protein